MLRISHDTPPPPHPHAQGKSCRVPGIDSSEQQYQGVSQNAGGRHAQPHSETKYSPELFANTSFAHSNPLAPISFPLWPPPTTFKWLQQVFVPAFTGPTTYLIMVLCIVHIFCSSRAPKIKATWVSVQV